MDIIVGFIIFIAAMTACLMTGSSMVLALLAGLVSFWCVALKRKYKNREIAALAYSGVKDSLIVICVMFLIGFVTATWRSAGTITFFVYYGSYLITPHLFVFIAFALSCVLSYAIGTSFGVSGTLGVILMALARSGGADPLITAGAVISGVYFGDRCSPVSSSAHMVAGITRTGIYGNIRLMFKTSAIPMVFISALYIFLSVRNPLNRIDRSLLDTFEENFSLSVWCIVPALFMLILPLFKINVIKALITSIISAFLVSIFVQDMGLWECIVSAVTGYKASGDEIGAIINGGGMLSMVDVCLILVISCSYSGIFNGTGMLDELQGAMEKLIGRTGRFISMIFVSIITLCIFCNQTIATLMCNDILGKPYEKTGASKEELAIDIENSCIVIAAVIPWAIACTVPLTMLQVDYGAMKYAYLPFLIPVFYIFTKKIWFKDR